MEHDHKLALSRHLDQLEDQIRALRCITYLLAAQPSQANTPSNQLFYLLNPIADSTEQILFGLRQT